MQRIIGYARVSTVRQKEDRQIDAMREYGVTEIITDKESGKDFDRPGYQRLMKKLTAEDTLVVKSLDRLGRSYNDIIEQWRVITKEIGASIVVLDMPLLDTREQRDLIGTLISDIVLQLLSYVSENERAVILERQKEGIAAARARGVRLGRPPMKLPEGYRAMKAEYLCGKMSATKAASRLGISHVTFLKWVRNGRE